MNYRFGVYELQPSQRRLLRMGTPVALRARAFDVLLALVERADQLVTKEDLLDLVWGTLVVEEGNLQVQISTLRKIIGTGAIATVTGRGYRFTPEVRPTAADVPISSDHGRHNLPEQVTSFIGRAFESAELAELVAKTRLVTLVGAGGIGKTRQALHVAADVANAYADGVWFVDLGPIVDPALLVALVANVIGVDLGPGQASVDILVGRFKSLRLLLVLDNCEHLIAATAHFVEKLLAVAPNVHVLATSREPLAIGGEHVFRLGPLAFPEDKSVGVAVALAAAAVQLFLDRAKAADAGFALDDGNANSIVAICRSLDGIPLAIEMAAARTPMFSIDELERNLDTRFRLQLVGRRTAVARHSTLKATLDWSYELLDECESLLFRRLAVFCGGFTLDAASSACSDDKIDEFAVIEMLAHLVSCSLVLSEPKTSDARYRLLETTRSYATHRLNAVAEVDTIRRRHALVFCNRFKNAFTDRVRMRDVEFRTTYLTERDNVRAAIEWAFGPKGDSEIGIVLTGASGMVWTDFAHRSEGQRWLDTAVERIGIHTPDSVQAALWHWQGALWTGELPQRAVAAYERSVELYRRSKDALALGSSLVQLGRNFADMTRMEEASRALAEAFPLLQSTGLQRPLGSYFWVNGYVMAAAGELTNARLQFEHGLSIFRSTATDRGIVHSLNALADIAWAQGDLDGAMHSLRECIALTQNSPLADRTPLAYPLCNLAGVLTERGALAEALIVAREALPLLRGLATAHVGMDHLALRAALAGKPTNAARIAGYLDAVFTTRHIPRQQNEVRARERLQALLSRELTSKDIERLLDEGSKINVDEVCRIALED